ncbi:MAG: hypothetical protein RXR20_31110, partial [Paraburkholderia sp.]
QTFLGVPFPTVRVLTHGMEVSGCVIKPASSMQAAFKSPSRQNVRNIFDEPMKREMQIRKCGKRQLCHVFVRLNT